MPVSAARVLRVIAGEELTDAELLGRFVDRRDEAAFALLVRRHGAMVYGVCRRLLPEQDAEDAFQATFLALARKARSAAPREVAGWLYGVARRAALLSRRAIARRRERTGAMPDRPAPGPTPLDELRAALDAELGRLPDAYRTVVVLCDLEGRTRREAAAMLGWPEGTVAGRLARARETLARRLARHAPAVSVAAALSGTAAARVPEVLAPAGAVPAGVAALTREVLGALVRGKLMKAATAALLLACAGFGVVLHAGQNPSANGGDPVPAGPAVPADPPKADDVVWGEEVNGLQAGLAADTRTCRPGGTLKFAVKVRNVGTAEVKITHDRLREYAPEVTAQSGVRVGVYMPPLLGFKVRLEERAIKPGETITLYNPEVEVASEDRPRLLGEMRVEAPTVCVGPGKYRIGYGRVVHSHPALATGTVGFEVKAPTPEAVTAWGKEVGGLQAGLEVKERRAYRHGETVTLTVRVRNVGKEAVRFGYVRQYLDENPPAVTGADGKPIPQGKSDVTGVAHVPVEVSLDPGKEVVLESRIHGASGQPYELRPVGGGAPATRNHPLYVGTGKVGLRYERVFGDSSIGRARIDPALGGLATGKLELEVTDEKHVQKGPLHVPANEGFRELKGKELEAYQTTNAWLEERLREAESIKVGSTYADVCRYFRTDGGIAPVGKSRFVNILCPYVKIDVEFEAFKGDTLPPTTKVTRVSRPYFEREFGD